MINTYPDKYLKIMSRVPITFVRKMGTFPRFVYVNLPANIGGQYDSEASIIYLPKNIDRKYVVLEEDYVVLHELGHAFHTTTKIITDFKVDSRVKMAYDRCYELWNSQYIDLKELYLSTSTWKIPKSLSAKYGQQFPLDASFDEFIYFLTSLDADITKKHFNPYLGIDKYFYIHNMRYKEFFCTSLTSIYMGSQYMTYLIPEIKAELEHMFASILRK